MGRAPILTQTQRSETRSLPAGALVAPAQLSSKLITQGCGFTPDRPIWAPIWAPTTLLFLSRPAHAALRLPTSPFLYSFRLADHSGVIARRF